VGRLYCEQEGPLSIWEGIEDRLREIGDGDVMAVLSGIGREDKNRIVGVAEDALFDAVLQLMNAPCTMGVTLLLCVAGVWLAEELRVSYSQKLTGAEGLLATDLWKQGVVFAAFGKVETIDVASESGKAVAARTIGNDHLIDNAVELSGYPVESGGAIVFVVRVSGDQKHRRGSGQEIGWGGCGFNESHAASL
jgi:hypothetical protein